MCDNESEAATCWCLWHSSATRARAANAGPEFLVKRSMGPALPEMLLEFTAGWICAKTQQILIDRSQARQDHTGRLAQQLHRDEASLGRLIGGAAARRPCSSSSSRWPSTPTRSAMATGQPMATAAAAPPPLMPWPSARASRLSLGLLRAKCRLCGVGVGGGCCCCCCFTIVLTFASALLREATAPA
jgi:hypothetical protein